MRGRAREGDGLMSIALLLIRPSATFSLREKGMTEIGANQVRNVWLKGKLHESITFKSATQPGKTA
jgi:hypothetical protein